MRVNGAPRRVNSGRASRPHASKHTAGQRRPPRVVLRVAVAGRGPPLAALLWLLETGIDRGSSRIVVWPAGRHGSGCPGSWPRGVITHAALGSRPGAATPDTSGKC
jgi:hypothetical protein